MIDNPWKPEEVWVWVLFLYVLKPTLWYAYKAMQNLRGNKDLISPKHFNLSFFGFLYGTRDFLSTS
eukprot:1188958-Prorocentrum_minimum.AAC.2